MPGVIILLCKRYDCTFNFVKLEQEADFGEKCMTEMFLYCCAYFTRSTKNAVLYF